MEESVAVIDFSALGRELQAALEADQRHWRENGAKFRALHQRVGTYEEFRDIVSASHLRPLEKKDKAGSQRHQPWNPVASSSTIQPQKQLQDQDSTGQLKPAKPQPQLRSVSEWSLDWRCLTGDSRGRYNLLLCHGGEPLSHMFRAEVPFGLLGEFLVVLSESLQCGHESKVIDVLEDLSQTARFSLNLALLSSQERKAGGWLMHQLKRHAEGKGNGNVEGERRMNTGGEDVVVEKQTGSRDMSRHKSAVLSFPRFPHRPTVSLRGQHTATKENTCK
ncbi:dynein axonemal assembly factor 19 [Aplochiton taeniatus]